MTSAAAGLSVWRQTGGSAGFDGVMGVPGLAAQEQLHEPDAALDQSAGDQAARAILPRDGIVEAIKFLCRFGFLTQMSSASLAADCIRAANS